MIKNRIATALALAALTAGLQARPPEMPRLPALKTFHLDTVLVSNGVARAAVAAPDDPAYIGLARRVVDAVRAHTGATLPLLTDVAANAELDQTGGVKRALIILGNLMTNKVSERLYCMEMLDVDAAFPGENGCLVQTVHDPMGDGRNFISLGGSDFKGVQAATQAFLDLLKPSGQSLAVGRLFRLEGKDKGPKPLDESDVNRKGFDSPEDAAGTAFQCGHILRRYRTPGYGRMFRHAVERIWLALKTGEKFKDNGPPSFGELPILWDAIEECEQFDAGANNMDTLLDSKPSDIDGFRLFEEPRVSAADDRTFISDTLYAYTLRLPFATQEPGDPGPGKNSSLPSGALYAGLYFARYYPELDVGRTILERVDRYFASPIKHWRVADNATGYGDSVWHDNLQYSLVRPNMQYFSSGMARKAADYHIVITSNLGRSGGFGDSLSWTKAHFQYHPVLYPMAAWYYRDGSFLWFFKKCGGKPWMSFGHYAARILEGRYMVSGLDETPPVRWLGVKPFPLDHWLYRAMDAPQPEDAHAHRYFDKMSFRAGFETTNQYLQLSGFTGGAHTHIDANAIINFSDNGCDFLDDSGYMEPDITEHNTVIISRNGMGGALPMLSRIENVADFDGVGFSETSISNYNGALWTRNIVWEKERYFAVFEEIEAQEDGEFGIACHWRTSGGARLSGREWRGSQRRQVMRLINLSGDALETHQNGQRLVQSRTLNLEKGRKTVVANLFFADEPAKAEAIGVESVASGVALVKQDGVFTLVGVGPCGEVAGLDTDAALFHIGGRSFHACGMTRLAVAGGAVRAGKPVSVFLDFAAGTGVVDAAEATVVTVSAGSETTVNAGPGRTGFSFTPPPPGPLEARQATLAGLFDATAAARQREETQAAVASRKEDERLKSRLRVLWECRDFRAAGAPADKSKERELETVIESGNLDELDAIVNATRVGELTLEEHEENPQAGGRTNVRWIETADRNGDGKSEILVGVSDGFVACLTSTGTPMWSTPALSIPGLRGITGPLRAVVGPPGNRKIVTASGRDRPAFIACLDADGTRLWESPLPAVPLVLFASDPASNGTFEVGMGAFEYAYGFSHEGKLRWTFMNQVKHPSTCGAAYDVDGDGSSEMTIGNDYYSGHVLKGQTGRKIMGFAMTWHAGPSAVAMGDLDGDGKGDIVIGDRMGYMEFCVPWNTKSRVGRSVAAIVTVIRFFDVNGDGKKEVIVGTNNGIVYVFDAAGQPLYRGKTSAVPRDVDVGDMDGNGKMDLLVDCEDNCMRILDDKGKQTARFTTGSGVRFVRAVELDGQRRSSECVVGSNDGSVIALRFQADGGD